MILWAFVFPLGILALAFSRNQSVLSPSKRSREPVKETLNPWLRGFTTGTLVIIVFLAAYWPNYDKAVDVAAPATYAPSNAWEQALHWMRGNTPEPLGEDKYYDLVPLTYQYPDTAYGVTSWWDYGYWITRTAHRIPSANPSQSPEPIRNVSHLFLSQTREDAQQYLDAMGTAYIILDKTMVTGAENAMLGDTPYTLNTTGKLWAVVTWAGAQNNDYTSTFYWIKDNEVTPIRMFDPDYYKLLLVKLYNFDGKASAGETPVVLSYEVRTAGGSNVYVLTEDPKQFNSYREALTYINNNPDKNFYLGSNNPYVNPIPIDAVTDFNLVYGSTDNDDTDNVPDVKVFQRLNPIVP
jgi:asparagine N-glycosylation enzyme membrane subunit Stt3